MANIAVLGTGLLGSGFALAALGRGETVRVWNRTADKARPLADAGATVCATPADAVPGCTRVHIVVSDDAAVQSVLDASLSALERDAVIVDHTTTQPRATAERASRLAARGIAYLHAPVFMGPMQARNAQGMMLASGPESVFRKVEAALRTMTGDVWYFGERSDKAAAIKLFGNAMIIVLVAGLADVFTLARATDVDFADVTALFGKFKLGNIVDARAPRMIAGDFKASFEATMARKDVRLMIETAGANPLAALPGIAARLDALIADGHGAEDLSVLAYDAVKGRPAGA